MIPLPESVQLTPQTHAATLEPTTSMAAFGAPGGVSGGVMGGVAGGIGSGSGGGTGGGTFRASAPPPPPAMPEEVEVEAAREESEPVAEGTRSVICSNTS